MGVAKAGLESANRYLARDLGGQRTRVNLVAAGPIATIAAKASRLRRHQRGLVAPRTAGLGHRDTEPVARVICALLSDFMPAVTGEIVHVDGGAHAMGADVR
jgi:enoyl-[acyl-carrier protein] reductase I